VLAYPAGRPATGRAAIQAVYQQMIDAGMTFAIETPLPTVRFENLALASTRSADNTGVRVQVLRGQPDGSWLRIIDRPEAPPPWPRPAGHPGGHAASLAVAGPVPPGPPGRPRPALGGAAWRRSTMTS
jgi:hypothetical protein